MRVALAGNGASRGLALGRARIRTPHVLEVTQARIVADDVDAEIQRLHEAIERVRDEIAALRQQVPEAIARELGDFLDLHGMLLDDPELIDGLERMIREAHWTADYALRLQRDRLVAGFDELDDPYFRSRREDIDHVIGRVHAALHRESLGADGDAGDVLVCESVAPSELAQLSERGVVAVVAALGSSLSHSAILARSLHVPLIVGAADALSIINEGDVLLVDGATGEVVVAPDPADLRAFRTRQREEQRELRALSRLRHKPSRTRDGVDIRIHANADSREDAAHAVALGAEGIGLFRTEFLFMRDHRVPDEDEQFVVYRDLVLAMCGRPVTIRTLDLGADKAIGTGLDLGAEANPALGLRGIRLSLLREALFATQLRAILRASVYGPVRILLPMVSEREEITAVRDLIGRCRRSLDAEGTDVATNIPLGAMIEVPAAILTVERLLPQIDFAAIGTNDLVQYLLAADRNNASLGSLYSPLHPAVLKVVASCIRTCQRAGRQVTLCGEIAADPRFVPLLLALGLTDFSVHPASMLEVRGAIRDANLAELTQQRGRVLRCRDRSAVERLLPELAAH